MGVLYKEKKITYDVLDEDPLENVFDNRDNSYLAIRTVSWNKSHPKLEIRRWYMDAEDNETPSKGITFMTKEGPHQLTHLLLKLGYGDNDVIDAIMVDRKANNIKPISIEEQVKEVSGFHKSKLEEIKENIARREQSVRFSAQNLMDNISTGDD